MVHLPHPNSFQICLLSTSQIHVLKTYHLPNPICVAHKLTDVGPFIGMWSTYWGSQTWRKLSFPLLLAINYQESLSQVSGWVMNTSPIQAGTVTGFIFTRLMQATIGAVCSWLWGLVSRGDWVFTGIFLYLCLLWPLAPMPIFLPCVPCDLWLLCSFCPFFLCGSLGRWGVM